MESDALFSLRNEFYLGNYQGAITEAHTCVCTTPAEEVERDWFVYRAYICMGNYDVVLSSAGDNHPSMQAVKLLASYLSSPELREVALVNLKQWLTEPAMASCAPLKIVAATIFAHEGQLNDALKAVHNPSTLELMAINVHLCILIHRLDLAEKYLKQMQSTDDDATLTQLAAAMVAAAMGGDRLQESATTFHEVGEKYSETPLTLNGQAAANMAMGNWAEAEKLLLHAQTKGSGDVQTTENLLVCGTHLRKPHELLGRLAAVLKSKNPNSAMLSSRQALSDQFDRLAQNHALA